MKMKEFETGSCNTATQLITQWIQYRTKRKPPCVNSNRHEHRICTHVVHTQILSLLVWVSENGLQCVTYTKAQPTAAFDSACSCFAMWSTDSKFCLWRNWGESRKWIWILFFMCSNLFRSFLRSPKRFPDDFVHMGINPCSNKKHWHSNKGQG